MTSGKMDIGFKDLVSSLPDALLCHVLSFLSTRDAALTSVLSKRWRYLLAFVPNLDFDNSIYDNLEMGRRKRLQMRQSFKVFVDRIMALQGNAPLNKFSLICETDNDPSSVDGWITNALERGVVDLDLYISPDYGYPLPSKVLISKTLVRLKVEGTDYFTPDVGEFFLPKLKTLYLDDVTFEDSGVAFSKLISGCHLLEELVMIGVIWDSWDSFSVSSPTLKRLKLCCDYIEENPKGVSFDTPSLVYFEFTNTVAIKYPKVNFDSLVEASVDLRTKLYHLNARSK
ncbi:PREDICTED: F-box/LRR-repeat protein At3g59190-like [Camelina sativa]|uniref:F-box/LRR-repeat protein At3g59190-like n=1 Tax=Camelina sativa TaxID=90675 RepID=A0ABM1R3K7_CAMSA|nr:PREDICTED: F-box/LRR-repeat protein At3g59190-like [Camelina sativa]